MLNRVWQTLLRIDAKFPLFVVVAWALLYGDRPFRLGFYTDDWWQFVEAAQGSKPFSAARLAKFVGVHTNFGPRPIAGLYSFLMSSLAGTSATVVQFLIALTVLATACSIRAWFRQLPYAENTRDLLIADFAVVFWLSLPWSVGANSWASSNPGLISLLLFSEATRRFWRLAGRLRDAVVPGLLLLASYLTYEASYFLAFPMALIVFQWNRHNNRGSISARRLFGFVAMVQLCALVFNRFISFLNPGQSKVMISAWPMALAYNLKILPATLSLALNGWGFAWWPAIFLLSVLGLTHIREDLAFRRHSGMFRASLVTFGVIALLTGTLTFSLAGYGYTAVGPDSRTLVVTSWAITVVLFGVLSALKITRGEWTAWVTLGAGFALIATNARAQRTAVEDWAKVWAAETNILSQAPADEFARLPAGSRVLFVGPSAYHEIPVFTADWDITAAVNHLPRFAADRAAYQNLLAVNTATDECTWKWSSGELRGKCRNPAFHDYPAQRLFLWDANGKLTEAPEGYEYRGSRAP